jgi:hypothetical protein
MNAWASASTLVALVLLGSGCFGLNGPPTAKNRLGVAQEEATDWSSHATIVKAACVEGPLVANWMHDWMQLLGEGGANSLSFGPTGGPSHTMFRNSHRDGLIGDGRCEQWVYVFTRGGPDSALMVEVEKSGSPGYHSSFIDRTGKSSYPTTPVRTWTLDSHHMLSSARKQVTELDTAAKGPNASVVSVLERPSASDPPQWRIAWTIERGAMKGEARFNADSGAKI